MFIRDSEQIYKFGKKRVFIKIENGDHIRVRIGGGFMNIDNFMEQYAQVEFEKIERADMLQTFITRFENHHSPLKTLNMSPVHSSRV